MNKCLNQLIISLFVLLIACKKPDEKSAELTSNPWLNLPSEPYNYLSFGDAAQYSDNFTQSLDNEPDSNRISNWGATLGRVLFYDKSLSKNNTISCSSCHVQAVGFTDTAQFSRGFEGGLTGRHSMTLINARYYASGRFFWDERAASLEEQVLMPIQDEVEMGLSLDTLVARVSSKPYYPELFEKAFGSKEINTNNIAKALAQFVRTIVAKDTKYHREKGNLPPNQPFPGFTAQENLGKEIFFGSKKVNCASCHASNSFSSDNPRNNGIRNGDFGAYSTWQIDQYIGAFKVPSLIDIDKRAPYMHDGSLATLEEVIEHYNSRLNNNDGHLDPHLFDENNQPMRMNLNPAEKDALLAFLKTLSDDKIRTEVAYSNPFRE